MSNGKLSVPMNWEGKGAEWDKYDLPTQLMPLLTSGGYHIDQRTGMITVRQTSGWNTPWIYTKSIDTKKCNLDHNIKFNTYKYIPPRCLQCWKVVVTPTTYMDLHKLYEIECAMDVPCKCGIEVRDYTSKAYGGYFYTNSIDEGRERYEQVRKAVDEHIGPDTDVLLKRGCTEYELKLKMPSPMWHMTPETEEVDEIIDLYVSDTPVHNGRQTRFQKAHVFKRWMIWAHSRGDFSYLPHNNGQKLVDDYVTFHEGDLDQIKEEIALGEAWARSNSTGQSADPELLREFRKLREEFAINAGVTHDTLDQLGQYMKFEPEVQNDSDQTK